MDFKDKMGPILAIGLVVAATTWMLNGDKGIVQANAETTTKQRDNQTSPMSELVKEADFTVQAIHSSAQTIVKTIKLSGYTEANNRLTLTNRLAGHVTKVHVQKGEFVKEGQPIISIDERVLRAKFLHAKALVKQRTLELEGVKQLTDQRLTSKVSVSSAEAALTNAKANLESLKIDLENRQVIAPFSGVVNEFDIKLNQWIELGESVATIVDNTPLKINAQLPQKYFSDLSLGTNVDVTINNQWMEQGQVNYISQAADSATRAIPFEIVLPNQNQQLVAGLSADVLVHLNEVSAHAISPALLSIDDNGQMSLKIITDNTVVEKTVTVVKSDRNKAWVTGLSDQALIISSGQGYVSAGEEVTFQVTENPISLEVQP